jgi:PKD repeat protein
MNKKFSKIIKPLLFPAACLIFSKAVFSQNINLPNGRNELTGDQEKNGAGISAYNNLNIFLPECATNASDAAYVNANFSPGDTISYTGLPSFCPGGNIVLTAGNPPTGLVFEWRRNGGAIIGTAVNFTATLAGTYTVTVDGILYPPLDITIRPVPVPTFTYTPNICSGSAVQFTSSVTGGSPPYSYAWNFAGGGTSTAQDPSNIFTSLGCGIGNLSTSLVVTDANGCFNNPAVTNLVAVKQAPAVGLRDPNHPLESPPFRNCNNSPTPSNPNFTITVANLSNDSSCISSYSLDWGDGSSIISPVVFPLSHTYTQLGAFNLVITGLGNNGCSNSKTYIVANQSNPGGGLSFIDGTISALCAPSVVPFIINNWYNNSPGTTYNFNFGDGSSISLPHPLNQNLTPDTIYHNYTFSSCPLDGFATTLKITNACKTITSVVSPIEVWIKPTAAFTVFPNPACVGQNVCFTNTGAGGNFGSSCSSVNLYNWNFGDGSNPSTAQNPCHIYSFGGIYNVSLTSTNGCGSSTFTKSICITVPPTPSFTINNNTGCTPVLVNATNTTNTFGGCAPVTYLWTVTYSAGFCGLSSAWTFINGSNASSTNPSFSFVNPGNYTIRLSVTNACGTFTTTNTVTVKKPPTVVFTPLANACGTTTFTPSATVTACGTNALVYSWSFGGGNPGSSSNANPGPVTFTGAGPHPISLSVTNECGTTTANTQFNIDTVSVSNAGPNQSLCGNTTTLAANSPVIGTGLWSKTSGPAATITTPSSPTTTVTGLSAGTYIFKWTITNGSCTSISFDTITVIAGVTPAAAGIDQGYCLATSTTLNANTPLIGTGIWSQVNGPAAIITNNTLPVTSVTGLIPGVYTFRWTISLAGCNSSTDDIIVTIFDNPSLSIAGPDQIICSSATTMAANTAVIGTGSWTKLAGPAATITTPSSPTTTITGMNAGTYVFRWRISNGVCPPSDSNVQITVTPLPSIAAAGADQNLCAATSTALSANTPVTGSGLWSQIAGTPCTIVSPASPSTTVTGLLPGIYVFRWTISNGVCTPSFDEVQVTINAAVTPADAGPPQTKCGTSVTMAANTPVIGTGLWTKIFGAAATITTPGSPSTTITGMSTGMYIFKWTITNGNCTSSANDTITIIAGVSPAAAGPDQNFCLSASATLNANAPAIGTGVWSQPGGPPAIITNIILPGTTVTGLLPGVYTFRWTISLTGCTSSSDDVIITIYDNPTAANAGPDQTICTSSTTMAANNALIGTGLWTKQSGPAATITNPSSPTTTITGLIAGTYVFKWTISNGNCPSSEAVVQIIVTPFPTASNAGPDQILCAATGTVLAANSPFTGAGLWSQVGGNPCTIVSPGSPSSTILGLAPGIYIFRWSISNGVCPSSTDDVSINVLNNIINAISANPTTICAGQTIVLSGGTPAGGTGVYAYGWQSSVDGIVWSDITGAIGQNYSTILNNSTYFRRKVISLPCQNFSNEIFITVQPALTNNSIAADQSICINLPASIIIGIVPAGGNGIYNYQWQQSLNGLVWTDIPGAIAKDYNPGVILQTMMYRRNVHTTLCSGPQASVSNVITITVHPDSKAIFLPLDTIDCAPFLITATNINLQAFPLQNAQYLWYVNGNSIGTGPVFPGTTIMNPGDTIIIKLKTTSPFGCRNDSSFHYFITHKRANPSFTIANAPGCGPLQVSFTNTTPFTGLFSYAWNFGNGTTSTSPSPGPVTYLSNTTTFNDTTYYITLSATDSCITSVHRDSVKVFTTPKARFSLDSAHGCSPFTVVLRNQSLGNAFDFYIDFGDGTKDTTHSVLTPVLHTYYTGVIDTFTIRLIAKNSCSRDTAYTDVIVSPITITPLITVSGSSAEGCVPHTAFFNNGSIGAAQLTWNFGDGSPLVTTANSTATVSHTYNTPGNFTIHIRLINNCSDTTVLRYVTVYPKPLSQFVLSKIQLCSGDSITTTNNSSNANGYEWIWGDGTRTTAFNATHRYPLPGNYIVQLVAQRISNIYGLVCTDTSTMQIQVIARIPAQVIVQSATPACAPYILTVTAPGTGQAALVQWTFYDPSTPPGQFIISGPTASYNYLTPGNYSVKLVVINAIGCRDSTLYSLNLYPKPVAGIRLDTQRTCNSDTTIRCFAQLQYQGNDPVIYKWFVNGLLVGSGNPYYHKFTVNPPSQQPVVFNIRVLVQNQVGCGDTSVAMAFTVMPLPRVKIAVMPGLVQAIPHTSFDFTDTVAFSVDKSYLWDPGDRNFLRPGRQISYTYPGSGLYKVRLWVSDLSTGCKNADSVFVKIEKTDGALYVPNAFYPNSQVPELRTFKPKGIGLARYKLQVFDDWGQMIFETDALNADGSPKDAWDGTYKGVAMPQGAYTWRITVADFINGSNWEGMAYPGRRPKAFGSITLFR